MTRRAIIPCFLWLALCSSTAFAASPPKDLGKSIADDAAAAFKDQRFPEAAELFEKAYALGNDKFVRLRNAGRAWEEAGKLEYARTQFQRYLEKVPAGPDHDEVVARLARVEARLAAEKTPKAPPEPPQPERLQPTVTAPVAIIEPEQPPVAAVNEPRNPTDFNWLPWTLVGGGAALVVGGAAWLGWTEAVNGRVNRESAAGQYSPAKLDSDHAVIVRNRVGAACALGAGTAGLVVGAILALRTGDEPATGQVATLLLPGGGGLAWAGRF